MPPRNAGNIINLPYIGEENQIENLYTISEGKYVVMYKDEMPYDMKPVYKLLNWIEEHNFKVAGGIVDLCIMDKAFYKSGRNVDFCCLQVNIK